MSIFLKIIVTAIIIGLGACFTGFLAIEYKLMQRLCLIVAVICAFVILSCLLYGVWQL